MDHAWVTKATLFSMDHAWVTKATLLSMDRAWVTKATLLSMDRAWVTQQRCSLWIAALGIDAESTNCFNGKILFYLGFQFVD